MESWRKRIYEEERASAKALWRKELGTGREWDEVRGSRGPVCRVLRPGEECGI